MNYLVYPMATMWITQSYISEYSHKKHYKGKPQSFPIDDQGTSNTSRDWFLCPCDEVIIKKITGVGSKYTNAIWLQSTSKVQTPTFNDYVTILVVHPNDDDLSKLKVGQTFKRGEKIFREGKDNTAGYHHHIDTSRGKYVSPGWRENSLGGWVITGKPQKPEDCFYIDKTTIKKDKDIKFITPPETPVIEPPQCKPCQEYKDTINELITDYDAISVELAYNKRLVENLLEEIEELKLQKEIDFVFKISIKNYIIGIFKRI